MASTEFEQALQDMNAALRWLHQASGTPDAAHAEAAYRWAAEHAHDIARGSKNRSPN